MRYLYSVGLRVDCVKVNTADTSATDISDSYIAAFSPCCRPGVLDNPVSVSVANNENGMVKVSSTVITVDDTSGV